jgi:predicted RNase H-like HicB family nuclease
VTKPVLKALVLADQVYQIVSPAKMTAMVDEKNAKVDVSGFDAPSPDGHVCRVWIHREDCGGFSAEIVTLPGVVSQGETEEEAIANLREAFKGAIEIYLERGSAIPWSTDVPAERPANVKEKRIIMHG